MKLGLSFVMLLATIVPVGAQPNPPRDVDPPMLGMRWARGQGRGHGGGGLPLMTWHNGSILPATVTGAIFWGPSWGNSSFAGDKITGLDSWYEGVGSSSYAATCDEYTGVGGQVTAAISYSGHSIDTSTASGGGSTSAILAEVCKHNPVSNGYYAVYVDLPRRHASYCAYHSWGTCGSTPVEFAFFWNLDGDAGCDPQDTSGLHSQGLASLADVSGHELSEARTDPSNGGWYDSSGQENGDKCNWTFGSKLLTFHNNSQWKIQGNWSNAAYNAGTGYTFNGSVDRGCIDGTN